MTTQVQLRRGDRPQNDSFIGAEAEMTVVTDDWSLRVHDGVTPGGHPVGGGGGGGGGGFPTTIFHFYFNDNNAADEPFLADGTPFTGPEMGENFEFPEEGYFALVRSGGIWNTVDPFIELDASGTTIQFNMPLVNGEEKKCAYEVIITTSIYADGTGALRDWPAGLVRYGTKVELINTVGSPPNAPKFIQDDLGASEYRMHATYRDGVDATYSAGLSDLSNNVTWTDIYYIEIRDQGAMLPHWMLYLPSNTGAHIKAMHGSIVLKRLAEPSSIYDVALEEPVPNLPT